MLIVSEETCPVCGAYWQENGYCANGHPKGAPIDSITARHASGYQVNGFLASAVECDRPTMQKLVAMLVADGDMLFHVMPLPDDEYLVAVRQDCARNLSDFIQAEAMTSPLVEMRPVCHEAPDKVATCFITSGELLEEHQPEFDVHEFEVNADLYVDKATGAVWAKVIGRSLNDLPDMEDDNE